MNQGADDPPLPRALAIVGPTASGKSRLALWLAERLALPVLCCDSVQVYRGLDIGSAKPDAALQARVPHRLTDLVAPDAAFSAGDYAAAALAEVGAGPALFAGGTGFYLRATAWTHSGDGVADADESARAAFTTTWEARERETPGCVHAALSRADPTIAVAIHPRNVVRAVRALWLCEAHGGPVSALRAADPPRPRLALALVVLEPDQAGLDRAIDARCDAMMRAGFLAEVEMLREAGYDARHKSMRSLGYRQLLDHLDGHLSLADAVAAIKLATRHYARRQRTYFKTQLVSRPGGSALVSRPGGSELVSRPGGSALVSRPGGSALVSRPGGSELVSRPGGSALVSRPGGSELVSRPGGREGASRPSEAPRILVTAPVWAPGVDLAEVTVGWLAGVAKFLAGDRVRGGAYP